MSSKGFIWVSNFIVSADLLQFRVILLNLLVHQVITDWMTTSPIAISITVLQFKELYDSLFTYAYYLRFRTFPSTVKSTIYSRSVFESNFKFILTFLLVSLLKCYFVYLFIPFHPSWLLCLGQMTPQCDYLTFHMKKWSWYQSCVSLTNLSICRIRLIC